MEIVSLSFFVSVRRALFSTCALHLTLGRSGVSKKIRNGVFDVMPPPPLDVKGKVSVWCICRTVDYAGERSEVSNLVLLPSANDESAKTA